MAHYIKTHNYDRPYGTSLRELPRHTEYLLDQKPVKNTQGHDGCSYIYFKCGCVWYKGGNSGLSTAQEA